MRSFACVLLSFIFLVTLDFTLCKPVVELEVDALTSSPDLDGSETKVFEIKSDDKIRDDRQYGHYGGYGGYGHGYYGGYPHHHHNHDYHGHGHYGHGYGHGYEHGHGHGHGYDHHHHGHHHDYRNDFKKEMGAEIMMVPASALIHPSSLELMPQHMKEMHVPVAVISDYPKHPFHLSHHEKEKHDDKKVVKEEVEVPKKEIVVQQVEEADLKLEEEKGSTVEIKDEAIFEESAVDSSLDFRGEEVKEEVVSVVEEVKKEEKVTPKPCHEPEHHHKHYDGHAYKHVKA